MSEVQDMHEPNMQPEPVDDTVVPAEVLALDLLTILRGHDPVQAEANAEAMIAAAATYLCRLHGPETAVAMLIGKAELIERFAEQFQAELAGDAPCQALH